VTHFWNKIEPVSSVVIHAAGVQWVAMPEIGRYHPRRRCAG